VACEQSRQQRVHLDRGKRARMNNQCRLP
jgi:hypothetical protein